jgi:hypothetical protein
MSINYSVYSNGNASSKTITVDFSTDYLASSSNGVSSTNRYFFKFTTGAKDIDNANIGAKVSENLTDLVLNGESQAISSNSNAYADIKSMIVDYIYDMVRGHSAGQWGTSVTEQKPMKFSR